MNTNSCSPLAASIRLILPDVAPASASSVTLLYYRDEAVFRELWLEGLESETTIINRTTIDWSDGSRQIFIVGNEPPDSVFDHIPTSLQGIILSSHFTATSWLAAWKVRFPEAATRIAVIDPVKADSTHGVSRALQTILAARDGSGQTLVPRAAVLSTPSLAGITSWLRDSKSDDRELPPHISELLKSTIWNELVSDRERNHALSNVLGAFLLQAEVGEKNPDPATNQTQEYLDALMHVCGTALKPAGAGSGGWIAKEVRDRFDGAVLIDDMADIWAGFLASAFGSGGGNSVRTTESGGFVNAIEGISPSPDNDSLTGLAGRLNDFLTSGRRRLSSADLIPSDAPDRSDDKITPEPWQNFVLFLDLRLGLGEKFQKQLLPAGIALLSLKDRNLPWLTDASRAKFKVELESGRTDETLLPRLIALLDPTLPIVIFSSTHRTELIGSFLDYGNIITAFRKPMLTGLTREWTEVVNELRSDFVSALDAASGILSTRKLLADLEPVEPLAV